MKILLLAGTSEARELAGALSAKGHDVTASLAGATRAPLAVASTTRVGGFGGDEGFEDWLDTHKPDFVIDATHPFANRITTRTSRICAAKNVAYLHFLRPAWQASETDNWLSISAPEEASLHIEPGSRVFLATGRQTLERFVALEESYLICRQIDPPEGPFPFPNGEFLIGRPPFSIEDEVKLFRRLEIDWLVVKNAGGDASRSKLDAARQLGLRVLIIARPPPPDAARVSNVAEALEWVNNYADH